MRAAAPTVVAMPLALAVVGAPVVAHALREARVPLVRRRLHAPQAVPAVRRVIARAGVAEMAGADVSARGSRWDGGEGAKRCSSQSGVPEVLHGRSIGNADKPPKRIARTRLSRA